MPILTSDKIRARRSSYSMRSAKRFIPVFDAIIKHRGVDFFLPLTDTGYTIGSYKVYLADALRYLKDLEISECRDTRPYSDLRDNIQFVFHTQNSINGIMVKWRSIVAGETLNEPLLNRPSEINRRHQLLNIRPVAAVLEDDDDDKTLKPFKFEPADVIPKDITGNKVINLIIDPAPINFMLDIKTGIENWVKNSVDEPIYERFLKSTECLSSESIKEVTGFVLSNFSGVDADITYNRIVLIRQ